MQHEALSWPIHRMTTILAHTKRDFKKRERRGREAGEVCWRSKQNEFLLSDEDRKILENNLTTFSLL